MVWNGFKHHRHTFTKHLWQLSTIHSKSLLLRSFCSLIQQKTMSSQNIWIILQHSCFSCSSNKCSLFFFFFLPLESHRLGVGGFSSWLRRGKVEWDSAVSQMFSNVGAFSLHLIQTAHKSLPWIGWSLAEWQVPFLARLYYSSSFLTNSFFSTDLLFHFFSFQSNVQDHSNEWLPLPCGIKV